MRAIIALFLIPVLAQAQSVLHYSETSGFDHNTRTVSLAMFEDFGLQDGYTVADDQDGSTFNSLIDLMQFDVIIFSNTSGDGLLDSTQRANFESFVNAGGSVLGIHAATDTYRHSTANGGSTGTWDFYPEMIGGSVQQSPNHVSGTPSYAMGHIGLHQSTAGLPDPWQKNEEYYYWESGYYDSSNVVVLEVEETIGPNGLVNSYDSARAVSWYRELNTGSRVFYTSLGHAQGNFTSDSLFILHLQDAVRWLMNGVTGVPENVQDHWIQASQQGDQLRISWSSEWMSATQLRLISNSGVQRSWSAIGPGNIIELNLPSGVYHLIAEWEGHRVHTSFTWLK